MSGSTRSMTKSLMVVTVLDRLHAKLIAKHLQQVRCVYRQRGPKVRRPLHEDCLVRHVAGVREDIEREQTEPSGSVGHVRPRQVLR